MKSFITIFLLMVTVTSIHLASVSIIIFSNFTSSNITYVIQAQPVSLPPPELVNAVFDEMALTVLSFNFPGIFSLK